MAPDRRTRWLAGPLVAWTILAAHDAAAVSPGQPAPTCALAALGPGPAVDLQHARGKVLYVDFWASWCTPCRKAFPFLNTLDADFRARGLQVVGVNVDEDPANARIFLERNPARFAVAADRGGACPRAFGVEGMPSSYLVDRSGVVRYVHLGFRPDDADALRHKVEQLLAEPAAR
jgi:thiol-disulfide isomerase/thioredoxin